jgi:hypothetical protein
MHLNNDRGNGARNAAPLPFDERYGLQIETGVARRGVALRVFYTYRVCDLKMCTTDLPRHNRDAPGAGHAV